MVCSVATMKSYLHYLLLAVPLLAPPSGASSTGYGSSPLDDHAHVRRSLDARTWAAETRSAFDSISSCSGCQSVLNLVKGLLADGNEVFLDLAKQLCASGTSYDAEFCDGVIAREAPVIADIIKDMELGSPVSEQFCITFLGVCDYPEIDEWTVPFPSRKPCASPPAPVGEKKPIQVVHYSDIHIDPLYVEGSSTECKKPTCCRPYTEADEPGKSKSPAGPFGDHNCDVPLSLEESMYKAIKEMFPHAAFTLFTGDIVDHSIFNTSRPYNEGEISDAYQHMDEYLSLVYATAGNHESHPANIFEPKSLGNDTQWVYNALSEQWSRWIGDDALDETRNIGAYSVKYPKGNLRIISLNTNVYYRFNFILYQKQMERDPNGQIAWLIKELNAAEKAGESVYIMGHMPLGEADALPNASNYLDQVVNRYSSTIKAMFFGHTHVDHFEISYSNYANRAYDTASAMSYICPSLTPTSGMPSFRVYDVDPDTFDVLDATTYIADMSNASFQTSGPTWKKYYSAKEAYGPAVTPPLTTAKSILSPAFWHNVTEAFASNQSLFDDFMSRKSRGWQDEEKCRGDCQRDEICQLQAGRSQDNCYVPKPGVHFSKRDDVHHHGKHDECGVSVPMEMFSALTRRQDLLELLQDRFLEERATLEPYAPRLDKRAATTVLSHDSSETPGPTESDCVALPPSSASSSASSSATTASTTVVPAEGGAVTTGSMGTTMMIALMVMIL